MMPACIAAPSKFASSTESQTAWKCASTPLSALMLMIIAWRRPMMAAACGNCPACGTNWGMARVVVSLSSTPRRMPLRCVAAHADVYQMFQNRAVTKSGRAGIEKDEQNIARAGSAAESVEMVALEFEGGNFLRFEFGLNRRRIELAERDADDVVTAGIADVGPGDFFRLGIRVHVGGA